MQTNSNLDEILEPYRPKPLPIKEKLREFRIRQVEAANYLGCPLGTLSSWLNGWQKMPKHVERKLHTLIQKAEQAQKR